MTTISVKHVDAFTDAPMQGNPAGVVLRGDGLTDGMMQGIAAEMSLPETAFVLPPTATGADMRLRWFTPVNEVPLCGHATVAAFHAIAEEGLHGTGEHPCRAFRVETRSGILPVTVERDTAKTTVCFGLPLPHFRPGYHHRDAVLTMLQLNGRELDPTLPIMVDKYLYVPVLDRRVLFGLHPDMAGVDAFQRRHQIGGICVFTTDTVEKNSVMHSRFFCPADGVNEDVVTGSANGPLGVYLVEQGVVRTQTQNVAITGEQGDCLGRRGRVNVTLGVKAGKVVQVEISGRAVTMFTAEMRLR
jgi:PhzF family phenazine biosynthesis protein